ncbi:hypothetical protein BKA70DRAFT_1442986 [Coprinopsis sp. MPI-PUGE-AT-0042]|nr:hypothetical protein BKA70DRAFT_1442986 [Coprinopsis sp. MPI-PUGE-AT-0042]
MLPRRRPPRNRQKLPFVPTQWLAAPGRRTAKVSYGTGIKIFPRIDIITPLGAFAQQIDPPPSSSQPAGSIEPSVVSSHHMATQTTAPNRRTLQLQAWVEKTVPSLVQPFMDLLANSNSLRHIDRVGPFCECGPHARMVDVTCIEFCSLHIQSVCGCALAQNLLSAGYFPSSPVQPTFAVDLRMLSFMHELHVRSSPNITAWSSALEEFLSTQGFATSSTDRLRRKVAACLRWYRFLLATKDILVDKFVQLALSPVHDLDNQHSATSQADDADDGNEAGKGDEGEDEDEDWVDEDGPSDLRTSAYLQRCCALCFGGDVCHEPNLLTDVIVALDANFQQKRRRPGRGVQREPPFTHPNTCFLSNEEVKLAKDHVDACRPPTKSTSSANEEDKKEAGMKVPNSVLSGCHDSFTAADEKRHKASTTHFVDTGLMALQCRHDNVLWLVNMTTPGERQFYAIALLLKLFAHLPPNARVGLLYDIACQLEQSCLKWELLGDLANRMVFAVSVFHVYGHRWPCQLIYHPRKCAGFGLADGEGCERFWAAIKFLIPSLRVSGSHHRRFVLDIQVQHLRRKSFEGQGAWIVRKWKSMVAKEAVALDGLKKLPWNSDTYSKEWQAQVAYQTRPLARVSKNAGKKAIESIITLSSLCDSLKQELAELDRRLVTGADTLDAPLDDLVTARESLQSKLASLEGSIKAKRKHLDLTGQEELRKLVSNRFFALKVNARAIRDRILSKLQNRRFEMERLEKVIRRGGSSEQKLHSHVEVQLKKQEPQISNLVKRYNTMCTELADMIHRRVAPPGSTCPPLIDRSSTSALDVDSLIWDDSYFDDSLDGIPEWMANEDLRLGIRLWLDSSRCSEERVRLLLECTHLQEWSRRAWNDISTAHHAFSENPGLSFQIAQQADRLFTMICRWRTELMALPLPSTFNHAFWGPSLVQLTKGTIDDLSSKSNGDGGEGQDEDVWQMLENLEVAELSEGNHDNDSQFDAIATEGQSQQSPTKRARLLDG